MTRSSPDNWDIYLFDHGVERRRASPATQLSEDNPVISADGRWLVFCSERDGDPDLFVIDLVRGGDPRKLIAGEGLEDQATFSADGQSIAFVSTYSGTTPTSTCCRSGRRRPLR